MEDIHHHHFDSLEVLFVDIPLHPHLLLLIENRDGQLLNIAIAALINLVHEE